MEIVKTVKARVIVEITPADVAEMIRENKISPIELVSIFKQFADTTDYEWTLLRDFLGETNWAALRGLVDTVAEKMSSTPVVDVDGQTGL